MPSRPAVQLRDTDVVAIADAVRRYAVAALGDSHDVDDVTQETVSRLVENRWRIDRRTAPGYAIATARSLLVSRTREAELADRHQHRLHDPQAAPDPLELALAGEEEAALAAAFAVLDAADRALLTAHHVDGVSSAALAALHSSTPGAISARLARARGRLRLEFCLQAHRRRLPDDRCRRILTAIATGDGRRQAALGASRHLPTCEDCTALAAAVTAPDRHRAALGALGLLAGLFALLRRLIRTHPAASTAGAGVTAAAAVVLVAYAPHHHPTPVHVAATAAAPSPVTPAPAPVRASVHLGVISDGANLLTLGAGHPLKDYVGQPVLGRSVRVLAVDANEGFWVGSSQDRIWVELATHGESRFTVKVGRLVDFAGSVVANPPGYPARVGVTAEEDAAELSRQGAHISVPATDIAAAPTAGVREGIGASSTGQ